VIDDAKKSVSNAWLHRADDRASRPAYYSTKKVRTTDTTSKILLEFMELLTLLLRITPVETPIRPVLRCLGFSFC
jgi:hypothetical protein